MSNHNCIIDQQIQCPLLDTLPSFLLPAFMASLPHPSSAEAKCVNESRFSDVMADGAETLIMSDRSESTTKERTMLGPTAKQQGDHSNGAQATAADRKMEVDDKHQQINVTVDFGGKRKRPDLNEGGADDYCEDGLRTRPLPPNPFAKDKSSKQLPSENPTSDNQSTGFIDGSSETTCDAPCLVTLNACLNDLLYQDGTFKAVTSNAVKHIEAAKGKLGEANTLFIEGVRAYRRDKMAHDQYPLKKFVSFEYLSKAQAKGCQHPVLYYFLGECCRLFCEGVDFMVPWTLRYYDMAIKGMLFLVSLFIAHPHIFRLGYLLRHIFLCYFLILLLLYVIAIDYFLGT